MKRFNYRPFGMARHFRPLAIILVAGVALSVTAPALWALAPPDAKIIIELNATDEDAGLQIFFDGPGWKWLEVFDPNGEMIFNVTSSGGVLEQGVTELFFESEEPSLDELPLDEFFDRFPEGQYTFVASTLDGQILRGKARLTHSIPDGPELLSPEEDAEVDPNDTIIEWAPVEDPPGSKIVGYQVIVSQEGSGHSGVDNFSVDLPPTTTSVTVPPEFLQAKTNYKFEVLAIETSGNQTISERTFKTQ